MRRQISEEEGLEAEARWDNLPGLYCLLLSHTRSLLLFVSSLHVGSKKTAQEMCRSPTEIPEALKPPLCAGLCVLPALVLPYGNAEDGFYDTWGAMAGHQARVWTEFSMNDFWALYPSVKSCLLGYSTGSRAWGGQRIKRIVYATFCHNYTHTHTLQQACQTHRCLEFGQLHFLLIICKLITIITIKLKNCYWTIFQHTI